jgi:predicted dienelactone hydrolase
VRIHRILHAALASLAVLVTSSAAKGVKTPVPPLLKTDKGLAYRVWLPADFASRRHDVPLILFSHGFGGCSEQSRTLTQALADAGYAVLAPNHRDEGCSRFRGDLMGALKAGNLRPELPFTDPAAWTEATEASRRDDIQALLAFALSHTPYKDAIDPDRTALMGHSLGGYTALAVAGGWDSWRDPRFKCVLALSPYATPFVVHKRMDRIAVPVMFQTGTRDIGIGPVLLRRGGYDQTGSSKFGARKYLIELKGAGHFAWTELNPVFQKTIADYAKAFFDRELRGKPAPLLDAAPSGQVAQYRHS